LKKKVKKMAKKLETIKLIASLEKAAKATKKPFWSDLAKRLNSSRRSRIAVDLGKLSEIASKNKGKTIVVPGKVLSQGELSEKVTIVAVSASEAAKAKIKGKGEFVLLADFAQKAEKVKVSDTIIVK